MGRLLSAGGGGTGSAAEFGDDMLRQFNYYGQVNSGIGQPNIEDFTEQDIAKLEQEVEDLLKNRFSQGGLMENNQVHPGLVNIRGGGEADGFRVTKSAHVGKRA